MSDPIERQAAIDAFDIPGLTVTGRENAEMVTAYLQKVMNRIKQLPTVQSDLIQCRHCTHADFKHGAGIYCKELGIHLFQWDYCSRAEREEQSDDL